MKKDFTKRVSTSIFLIIILLSSFFLNKYFWLMFVSLLSLVSYIEFENLFLKIKKIKNNFLFKIRLIIIVYLFFLILISFNIYDHYLLFVITICTLSDTGGYVIGKTFGGIKLTKISPNKTISGAIGSLIFSLIPLIYLTITENYDFFLFNFYIEKNYIFNLFTISIFLSITCQIGDLLVSLLKRKANVKDTGKILPGHGGLLDRIDGIIFVIPISYIIFEIFL